MYSRFTRSSQISSMWHHVSELHYHASVIHQNCAREISETSEPTIRWKIDVARQTCSNDTSQKFDPPSIREAACQSKQLLEVKRYLFQSLIPTAPSSSRQIAATKKAELNKSENSEFLDNSSRVGLAESNLDAKHGQCGFQLPP